MIMNPMTQEIIGQILGIIATIITFLSYQMNTKKTLLIAATAATLCTCLSYLFLGASSGFVLNVVCLIRNVAFIFRMKSPSSTLFPLAFWP